MSSSSMAASSCIYTKYSLLWMMKGRRRTLCSSCSVLIWDVIRVDSLLIYAWESRVINGYGFVIGMFSKVPPTVFGRSSLTASSTIPFLYTIIFRRRWTSVLASYSFLLRVNRLIVSSGSIEPAKIAAYWAFVLLSHSFSRRRFSMRDLSVLTPDLYSSAKRSSSYTAESPCCTLRFNWSTLYSHSI